MSLIACTHSFGNVRNKTAWQTRVFRPWLPWYSPTPRLISAVEVVPADRWDRLQTERPHGLHFLPSWKCHETVPSYAAGSCKTPGFVGWYLWNQGSELMWIYHGTCMYIYIYIAAWIDSSRAANFRPRSKDSWADSGYQGTSVIWVIYCRFVFKRRIYYYEVAINCASTTICAWLIQVYCIISQPTQSYIKSLSHGPAIFQLLIPPIVYDASHCCCILVGWW